MWRFCFVSRLQKNAALTSSLSLFPKLDQHAHCPSKDMPILKLDCCEVVYTLCTYRSPSSFIIYRRSGHKVLASDETPSEKKKSVPTSDDYHHPPVRASTVRVQSAGFGLIGPVSHRMLRSNKKYSSAWGSVFLGVVVLFGGRTDKYDIESAEAGPQCFPHGPSMLLKHLWEKSAQAAVSNTSATQMRSLREALLASANFC